MLIVVALGGNALLRRGQPMTADNQRTNVKNAAAVLADLAKAGHALVITHGNGPQVGLLALQSAAMESCEPSPLDILDAESAGMIGYMLQQELGNSMRDRTIATVITQVKVDPEDQAFDCPTKPIGPVYEEPLARMLATRHGWTVAKDNEKWRRVVPSPKPCEIVEVEVLQLLIRHGVTIICAGGGGVPVMALENGHLTGVEAVIDKDLVSSLLARQIGADMLLLLTDVDAVYSNWGTPAARVLAHIDPLKTVVDALPAGSMGPKVAAAVEFASNTGKRAAIGAMQDACDIVRGIRGTQIAGPCAQSQISRPVL